MKYFPFLLLLICAPVVGQDSGNLYVALQSGFSLPRSPDSYSTQYGIGPNFGVKVGYGVPSGLEFAVAASHTRFSIDEEQIAADRGYLDAGSLRFGQASLTGVSAEVRMHLGFEGLAPYALAGAGIRRFTPAAAEGEEPPAIETEPAILGGVGLLIPMSRAFGAFAEVRLEQMFADEPLTTAGLKLGLVLQVGSPYR